MWINSRINSYEGRIKRSPIRCKGAFKVGTTETVGCISKLAT